jgi:hypothetical protein
LAGSSRHAWSTASANWPGLRTFRSERFRIAVAAALLAVGVGVLSMVLLRLAQAPDGQFGIDFADYHVAAQRVVAGQSPYAPAMLRGPIDAQGQDRYRYPPPFAQLLVPLTALPAQAAASVWLAIQGAAVMAAVWLAGSVGGAGRSVERVLWSAVAATYFLPVFDTLWKGNVSGIVALGVAMTAAGGLVGTTGAFGATVLKLVPVALVPAAVAQLTRRQLAGAVAVLAVFLAASVLISPDAWADYAVVLPNLLAGSADYANNLAPGPLAATLGAPPALVTAARLLSLAAALLAAAISIWAAWRAANLPLAVAAGTFALLLLPSALWYHYLVVALPIGALAWARARPAERGLMVAGGAAVSLGLAWLPLAVLGTVVFFAGAVRVLARQQPAALRTAQ